MAASKDVSFEKLTARVKEIVRDGDLDLLTTKLIRKQLETEFRCSLLSHKKELSAMIERVINENEDSEEGDDSDEDDKKLDICLKKDEDEDKESENKKRKKSTSSSEDEDDDDANLARKLQEEEESSIRRTRSGKGPADKKKRGTKDKKNTKSSSNETKPKKVTGYMKTVQLSEELAAFLGDREVPRHEIVKRTWEYVKQNNLLDPKNKQFALCDEDMLKVFGRKRIRMFGMMKHLAKHITS